jgi:hypothetical protein
MLCGKLVRGIQTNVWLQTVNMAYKKKHNMQSYSSRSYMDKGLAEYNEDTWLRKQLTP